jgi:hypothetical protein
MKKNLDEDGGNTRNYGSSYEQLTKDSAGFAYEERGRTNRTGIDGNPILRPEKTPRWLA